MKKERLNITQNDIRELITYDPISGKAYWNKRDVKWFKCGFRTSQGNCNGWNARYAGKEITKKSSGGYILPTLFRKSIALHHLIWLYMTGEWPKDQIDHINGIRTDNRWCNLREVTNAENGRNQKRRSDNTSGQTGVYRCKRTNRWWAQIRDCERNKVFLGYFSSIEQAVAARKAAEIEYGYHENHGRD